MGELCGSPAVAAVHRTIRSHRPARWSDCPGLTAGPILDTNAGGREVPVSRTKRPSGARIAAIAISTFALAGMSLGTALAARHQSGSGSDSTAGSIARGQAAAERADKLDEL